MGEYSIIHNFGATILDYTDGEYPTASVILDSTTGTLYGTCQNGGANSSGTLFSYNINTLVYSIIHDFGATVTDGTTPVASVFLFAGILYGTCYYGGANTYGTLFSYNISTSAYSILHNFGATVTDGISPKAAVILNTTTGILYGTCFNGGTNSNNGTLFSYNISTTAYSTIHNFGATIIDGNGPISSVFLYNGLLYGTCSVGGTNSSSGTLYSYNISTSAYSIIHDFGATVTDGISPVSSVFLYNELLYGTCLVGGANSRGTLYSYNINTLEYSIVYDFGDTNLGFTDGEYPSAAVILNTTTGILYSTCSGGGANSSGTLFSYNISTTAYSIVYDFGATNIDGITPEAAVFLFAGILYGTCSVGGTNSGSGTLYSYNINTPTPTPTPISNICFPAGTDIKTDQGIINIDLLDKNIHTLQGKPIKYITKTVTLDKYLICIPKDAIGRQLPSDTTLLTKDHKIEYKGQMVPAERFLNIFDKVRKVTYTGDVLYNVLLEEHGKMEVNGLMCETLHPENSIAKLYMNNYSEKERDNIIIQMNEALAERDIVKYKHAMQYLA